MRVSDKIKTMLETDQVSNETMGMAEQDHTKKQVYELGFLFLPTLTEENLAISYGNLKELIASFGGNIISSDNPRIINLAYEMSKTIENKKQRFSSAHFSWVKFEMETAQIQELKKKLDLYPDMIRFLIIKTIRENTIAPRKYTGGKYKTSTEKKENNEEVLPMDKEVVDKEIDALAEAAV